MKTRPFIEFTELELREFLQKRPASANEIAYQYGVSVEDVEDVVQLARQNGALVIQRQDGRYTLAQSRDEYNEWKRIYVNPVLSRWIDALHGMDKAACRRFADCKPGDEDIIYLSG